MVKKHIEICSYNFGRLQQKCQKLFSEEKDPECSCLWYQSIPIHDISMANFHSNMHFNIQ